MRSKGEKEGKRGIIEETQKEPEEVSGEKRRRVWCSKTRRIMGLHREREREDERGCGNIADAHVKHGGEGGRDGKESLAGITKPRDEVRKPLAT